MKSISRPLLLILLSLSNSVNGQDLKRYDPYEETPPALHLTLGNPRLGFAFPSSDKVARIGKSDYWLIGGSRSYHQSIFMVKLDRELGETPTQQILKDGRFIKKQTVEGGSSRFSYDDCENVRFDQDGKRLIAGSERHTLIVDLKKPDQIEKRLEHGTNNLEFTSDGEISVHWDMGGAWPMTVSDWKSIRDERMKTEAFHCCPIEELAFSPDSKDIIGKSGVVRLEGEIAFGALKSRRPSQELIDISIDPSGDHILVSDQKSITYRKFTNPGVSKNIPLQKVDILSSPRFFAILPETGDIYAASGSSLYHLDLTGAEAPKSLPGRIILPSFESGIYLTANARTEDELEVRKLANGEWRSH